MKLFYETKVYEVSGWLVKVYSSFMKNRDFYGVHDHSREEGKM
jgi:hypothetical protein